MMMERIQPTTHMHYTQTQKCAKRYSKKKMVGKEGRGKNNKKKPSRKKSKVIMSVGEQRVDKRVDRHSDHRCVPYRYRVRIRLRAAPRSPSRRQCAATLHRRHRYYSQQPHRCWYHHGGSGEAHRGCSAPRQRTRRGGRARRRGYSERGAGRPAP